LRNTEVLLNVDRCTCIQQCAELSVRGFIIIQLMLSIIKFIATALDGLGLGV